MAYTYSVFEGKKSLVIPKKIMNEYEEKVSAFTENTANYFMEVLELKEDMTEEELSATVVAAMKEDCEDSECVKEILSDIGHLMNELVKSLNKCSVVMLLGSGKTTCLYKLEQTMASTQYIDFKRISEEDNKILLNDVLISIAQNKPIIYLLDNFSFAQNPEHFLNVIENELTGKAYPDKIKIVFGSTNSSTMEKLFCKTFCGCHACIIGTTPIQ